MNGFGNGAEQPYQGQKKIADDGAGDKVHGALKTSRTNLRPGLFRIHIPPHPRSTSPPHRSASIKTKKAGVKFILATDAKNFLAEDLNSGDIISCDYKDFPDHFGFFLPLAGFSTVKQIRENSFDIKATGRLNRLYVQLLKDNPEWGIETRRHDINNFMARDKAHIVAMTGSYFRGDAEAVLSPEEEAKFDSVTYTYYEQLNGYQYLKTLDIGYFFYSGSYADDILKVLNPDEKTIIHIPNVNARESTKDKFKEVEHIINELGDWQGVDDKTGFQLVKTPEGRILKIADLVDNEATRRDKVSVALKDPGEKNNRDHVDIIIALGMAKEGFDWIWCEHALTVGYRGSLTEIVQIIGRATRDAKGKSRARFTNLIAEPDASEEAVTEAVNDTLKAIAASLLMEQVLVPRFNFTPKTPTSGPIEGVDYGEGGYDSEKENVGFNEDNKQIEIEIKGIAEPKSKEAKRICKDDLNELIAVFVQDKTTLERGLFDDELVPEELTQVRMGKIVKDKYTELSNEDQEAVRQHAITALNLTQKAKEAILSGSDDNTQTNGNTALIDGIRKFAMDVRELDIDLIDRINPFSEAYAILAKTMSEESLKQIAAVISARKIQLTPDEARDLAKRALKFKQDSKRLPEITSSDPWEKKMAEGVAYLARMKREAVNG